MQCATETAIYKRVRASILEGFKNNTGNQFGYVQEQDSPEIELVVIVALG